MQMISTGAALGVNIEGIDLARILDIETINCHQGGLDQALSLEVPQPKLAR